MKVGIICYPFYGGSGVLATELGKGLAQAGLKVHFISYNQPFRLRFHENIFYHRVTIPQYEVFPYTPYTLALINKIAEVVEQENLDLLHAHYAVPHSLAAGVALEMCGRTEVPLLTTLHGTDITLVGNDESFFRLTAFSMEKSAALTAVSDYLARETQKVFRIKKPVHRIYNFVDTGEYYRLPPEKQCSCFRRGKEKILVHISNFRRLKRVGDVVKIFELVNRETEARLLLVGDGPTCGEAHSLVREKGLEEKVDFLGAQESVVAILSACDLLLLPSEKESFGLVNIEAMACEVPVVATNTGGIPEVVKHGETGFLSPLGDVEGMAQNALRLLQDDELRQEMGRAGRRRVKELFSAAGVIPCYRRLYEELTGF